jgi:DNA-binding transcriptional LysR family regulator
MSLAIMLLVSGSGAMPSRCILVKIVRPTREYFVRIVELLERIRHRCAMKRSCPTILELLALDAVARHGSVTVAAATLCVSVSAISKQLAGLEKFVGKPLLKKSGRGVQLTATGREYWIKISPSLRTIEAATYEARSDGAGVLTLASAPTFLTKWLIPRLAAFRRRCPDVTFSFRQHLGANEAFPSDIDAAIRYGAGDWEDVRSDYIAGCEFVCIAAPELVKRGRRSEAPTEIIRHTLLHHEQAPQAWQNFAAKYRIDEAKILAGPSFAQYSAVIQAALSGLGVGLVPRILVEDELAERRLLTVGEAVSVDQGHYFCYVADKLERPVFAAFREWLLDEGMSERHEAG